MNVTLVHPIHGAKVATIEAEVEADEQNGWSRYNPETPSDSEEAAPVNLLGTKRKYTRKVIETEAAPEGV
jgi:hypothetical protein